VILDTNADLNLYKEIWKEEEANGPSPTGSCCAPVKHSTSEGKANLPDVDFNLWTGELVHKTTQYRLPLITPLLSLISKALSRYLPLSPTVMIENTAN
jgi:hypothetical protein